MNSPLILSASSPELLSVAFSYNVTLLYIPFTIAFFAAILGLGSYRSKSKLLNMVAWIVALFSLLACSILKETSLEVYAASLAAAGFIGLLARAESRSKGRFSLLWGLLLTTACQTIACIIANESIKGIGGYVCCQFLEHHRDISWVEDIATYLLIAFLIILSLALNQRLIDRQQLRNTRLQIMLRCMFVSTISGLGTIMTVILYDIMGLHCFPHSFGSIFEDEGVGIILIGMIVFLFQNILLFLITHARGKLKTSTARPSFFIF